MTMALIVIGEYHHCTLHACNTAHKHACTHDAQTRLLLHCCSGTTTLITCSDNAKHTGRCQCFLSLQKAFQQEEKPVGILSSASSTGISLHASTPTSKKRCMVLFELGWSAESVLQILGRIHRSGQYKTPEFVIVSAPSEAEQRFSATVSAKLSNVGALTSGNVYDKSSASIVSFKGESLLGSAGRRVARRMSHLVSKNLDDECLDPRRFLNRLLAMVPKEANQIFRAFYEAVVQELERDVIIGVFFNCQILCVLVVYPCIHECGACACNRATGKLHTRQYELAESEHTKIEVRACVKACLGARVLTVDSVLLLLPYTVPSHQNHQLHRDSTSAVS